DRATQIIWSETVEGFGFEVRTVTTEIMRSSHDDMVFAYPKSRVVECDAGWPFRCFAGTERPGKRAGLRRVGQVSQPITFKFGATSYERGLPLRVRWGALAIDTLILAFVPLGIVVAPSLFRTWRRERRGLCV